MEVKYVRGFLKEIGRLNELNNKLLNDLDLEMARKIERIRQLYEPNKKDLDTLFSLYNMVLDTYKKNTTLYKLKPLKYTDLNEVAKAIRNHWSIENKLHWHLDFTFKEDKNTTMNKNALMNLQIINKFCLGILNKIKSFHDNASLRRIKKRMQMNFEKWLVRNICYLSLS